MKGIEYNTWLIKEQYWEQKLENARLENDYLTMKIQKLKEGDE